MSQTTLQEVEAGVLSFFLAEYEANQTTIEGWIGTGTAELQAGLANLLKNIPSVKGLAGIVVGPVEVAFEAAVNKYVANLVATKTPAALFALGQTLIQHLITDAGGSPQQAAPAITVEAAVRPLSQSA